MQLTEQKLELIKKIIDAKLSAEKLKQVCEKAEEIIDLRQIKTE